jgi:hypothetical protein
MSALSSLFTSLLAFAKADAEKKGIPVLITFLQGYSSSTNAIGRALALAKLQTDALAAGATILQDIQTDLATELQAELTTIQSNPTAP